MSDIIEQILAVVKPLEWEPNSPTTPNSLWVGVRAINRHYTIDPESNVFRVETQLSLSEYGPESLGLHPTLDAAKAAAQADYEQRILSALASGAGPVAWRYRDFADGWIYTTEINREYVEMTGVAFEPLAAPLNDAELLEAAEAEVKRMLSPQATATWGDSGPIPGQHFGDEFAVSPQAVAPAEEIVALRRMSDAHREHAQSAVEHSAALNRLLSIAEANLAASEAEASDLRRKLEEHRKALEPFGEENDLPANLPDETRLTITFAGQQVAHATFGDFRRARALSERKEGQANG